MTLKAIAAKCGISSATMSRVLNHPELVRPELRERVQAILAREGYVPHGAARSLASRRTRTMGAVVPTVDSALFAKIVDGVQQTIHVAASSCCSPAATTARPGRRRSQGADRARGRRDGAGRPDRSPGGLRPAAGEGR